MLRKWGADAQAHVLEKIIQDLTVQDADGTEVSADSALSLGESGYSEDHLGRLVRAGTLRNYGRKGAPRVRRGDLPRRAAGLPQELAASSIRESKAAIARAIMSPRGGEH